MLAWPASGLASVKPHRLIKCYAEHFRRSTVPAVGPKNMRIGFCWRCKKDVPMLDDNEFEQITTLLSAADQELPEYREAFNIPDGDVTVDELLRPVFDVYEKMT